MSADDALAAVLVDDPEPVDTNGNGLGRYDAHGFLSRYDRRIGVDSRGLVVYLDGDDTTQTALLDADGGITSLVEGDLYGESAAAHVVNVADEYGAWRFLEDWVADEVRAAFGDDLDVDAGDAAPHLSGHARDRWRERVGGDPPDAAALLDRSVHVDVDYDREVYVDTETEAVLLVDPPTVVTVYPRLSGIDDFDLRDRIRRALVDADVY
ncbi:hypothetical protein [Halobaculum sp. D14]|uniref:hypothetical protein n=1 Tax=unclassified Halobaculum TaxID=2640896 RepID=UPI003EC0BD5D